MTKRFMANVTFEPNTGCWLWTGNFGTHGYGRLSVNGRQERAHRIAWLLAKGPIPPRLGVLHRCDLPACVNPAHLFVGTQAMNMQDMAAKGRSTQGRSGTPGLSIPKKLTRDLAAQIRSRAAAGESKKGLARTYGIAPKTVRQIVAGSIWR